MSVKIVGMTQLVKKLKKSVTFEQVKHTVRKNGAGLEGKMARKAEFGKGYQTGTTKRSVGLEITAGGLTAEVGPTTEYSEYLEYGTRFMEAQPFVGPAYNEQKEQFKKDMKKLAR